MGREFRHLLSLGLLSLSLAVPGYAEDGEYLKDQQSASGYDEMDAQWTPGSVTVVTSEEIEATFRRTLEDLEGYVPGLVIDPVSGAPQGAAIALRGIHSNESTLGLEPAVPVIVDGVYIGTHDAQNQHLFDFERVEVARGPQGMFTGAPAEGGAIYITRTRPTGGLGVKTRLSAGDFNGNNLDAVVNFPLNDQLAAKVSVSHQKRDGADLKNLISDRREYGIDRTSYNIALAWQRDETWSVLYSLDLDRDESDTPGLLNFSQPNDLVCVPDPTQPNTTANCGSIQDLRLPESGNRQRFLQNFSNNREYEADTQSIIVEGELFGHELISTTGYRNTKTTSNQDLDGTSVDRHSITEENDYEQISTDLKLRGEYSENLSYTLGLYYFNSEYDLFRRDFFVLDTLTNGSVGVPNVLPGQTLRRQTNQESTTLSAYAHAVYRWDEQWIFDFGIRGSRYEKDFDHTIFGLNPTPNLTFLDTEVLGDKEFNEVSGTLGFSYEVDSLAMVYGRYGVDHTPGGFNERGISLNSSGNYETTTTQGLELGLKSHWLDNRLRWNMAFYNNYQDDKVEYYAERFPAGNIEFTYDNISEVEVRGFDLEIEYAVTDNLYLRSSWGHINSDYVRFEIPDLTVPGTTIEADRDPERSPANIVYLNGRYSVPFRSGAFNIYLGYTYFDEYRSDLEIPIGLVRTYSTWDASLEYAWQDYVVRVFSQNINDKRFALNAQRTFASQFVPSSTTATSLQGIATLADVNRPRYTGIEFIWQPKL